MEALLQSALTLKFMSMLADVYPSTLSRYISETSSETGHAQNTKRKNFRFSYLETRRVLSRFISNKRPIAPDKKIHAFYNFKGGTGKTSLCYQVGLHLALCGYKILLIDADPQSHLTISLGIKNNYLLPTLYDGIVNNVALDKLIVTSVEGIDVVPCNLSLTNIEVRIQEMVKKEEALKRYLEPAIHKYDFVIFDCNPSISNLNRNILTMCDFLDIVCETHPYSVHGMKILFEDLDRFYRVMEISKPEIIIIPNKYEDRSNLSAEALAALYKYYNKFLKENFSVRKSDEFPKSARDKLPISYFCKSNSIAFEDIKELVRFIIEKAEVKRVINE